MTLLHRSTLFLGFALLGCYARAEVVLAPLFSDGAVLQRDKTIPIWGRAEPGEKVVVSFAEQRREATTGPDGRWIVLLEPSPARIKGSDIVISGRNTVRVRDVVVGEVWLCSGQSNMEWPVARAADAPAEMAAANFPLIRQVKIDRAIADAPMETVPTSGWKSATPDNVGAFTAVGYFFARDIHQKLGVPIGIINSSWGGTPVEAWMSPAALASDPAFGVVDERWAAFLAAYPGRNAEYQAKLGRWTERDTAAKAEGRSAHDAFLQNERRPGPPRGWEGDPWRPRGLFNGMINPLLPYALRGVLWYQGENNSSRASEYHALFSAMITAWRAHFGQGDIPFYWVNLANFDVPRDATGTNFAFLRGAQTETLALPNTGQAIAIDIGEPDDIHPRNKQEVGRRLARLARNRVYGIVGDDTGPTYVSATREGSAMRVRFSHAGSGLVAHDRPVQSLQLAGADGIFHPAEGRIDRDMLIVSSPAVKEPVAVRYAWSNAPEANLYNGAGLPAVPFRSDAKGK